MWQVKSRCVVFLRERERGRKMIITYQKNQEGAWVLSAFVGEGAGEYLLTRSYYDYTKRQAGEMFRKEIKREKVSR